MRASAIAIGITASVRALVAELLFDEFAGTRMLYAFENTTVL